MEDHTNRILERFEGQYFIYIGEDSAGCTGSPRFHEILKERFTERKRIDISNFPRISDRIMIYERER